MATFTSQLSSFADETEEKADRILRRSALDVLRRLVIRTPVDTGRLRGNWTVGLSKPRSVDQFDKNGGVTILDGESELSNAKIGTDVFIVNNLPYAVPIENGHSQQAPSGMLAITVAEWPGIVADASDAEK